MQEVKKMIAVAFHVYGIGIMFRRKEEVDKSLNERIYSHSVAFLKGGGYSIMTSIKCQNATRLIEM